ncbi:MAG: PIG-L family deacetylase [Proteobacteria bacterium]|nr:PIG-L family deacetylase [Pseudomonadota bacterium]
MATILAVHAHPDDIEHLAAGTLAVLAARGHSVRIATLTAGECGSDSTDLQATGRIRRMEAAAAAAVIGGEYRCAGLPDLGVFNEDRARRAVTELIRWAEAEVVLAASPADYHPDHEAASELTRDACFAASVPNYRTGAAAPLAAIPHLYFMDPIGGRDRQGVRVVPDFGCDIAAGFEAKRRMLSAHESQAAWVARQHGIDDHLGSMEAWSRRRGADFGREVAEGFRQYRHEPYPKTPRLQELLGDALLSASS